MFTTMQTKGQIVNEAKKELDRTNLDPITKEIFILFVKTAFELGRIDGLMESINSAQQFLNGPEPKPETEQPNDPDRNPEPEPAAPEPQGKMCICDGPTINVNCPAYLHALRQDL